MTTKEGWHGRYFEDFEVGDVYQHPLGRTVTTTDNMWFTLLTQNTAPIHFDHHYAAQTEFGKPLVDSTFTLALVTGQSVTDISQNVFANLGWDEVRLPNPVFEGDTIYSQSEVLEKRESRSRPNVSSSRSSAPSWSTSAGRHLRSHAFGQETRRERNQEQNNEDDGEQQEGHWDLAPCTRTRRERRPHALAGWRRT